MTPTQPTTATTILGAIALAGFLLTSWLFVCAATAGIVLATHSAPSRQCERVTTQWPDGGTTQDVMCTESRGAP